MSSLEQRLKDTNKLVSSCWTPQPLQSIPAEKITKKPIPDEHLVLKTTFEGLIQKCLTVATDPVSLGLCSSPVHLCFNVCLIVCWFYLFAANQAETRWRQQTFGGALWQTQRADGKSIIIIMIITIKCPFTVAVLDPANSSTHNMDVTIPVTPGPVMVTPGPVMHLDFCNLSVWKPEDFKGKVFEQFRIYDPSNPKKFLRIKRILL